MSYRKLLKNFFEPVIVVVAAVYFVIDATVLSLLKPLLKIITGLKVFQNIAEWIASLGPYPTLVLFVVPLILLEPIKPFSAYLIASGHFWNGILVLTVGEILKIIIVERIFHIGKEKLLTIRWFAWCYNFVMDWVNWLQALPPWQAVKSSFANIVHWVHKLKHGRRA